MSAQCCNEIATVTAPSTLIPLGIFVSSLLGSIHCVGMCGGLMIASKATTPAAQVMYHFGRLIGYVILGSLAGALGSIVTLSNSLILQQAAGVCTALLFFGIAISMWRGKGLHVSIPIISTWITAVHTKLLRSQGSMTSFLVGLFTMGLPCGWLYVYLLGAASTGSSLFGALYMSIFWLGTVPALSAFGFFGHSALSPITHKFPKVSAILLFALGCYSLISRF